MKKITDDNINRRIEEICDKLYGGNVTKMAKGTFISRTTILSIIGDQQSAPGYEVLRRIVEIPSVNISEKWLLTGKGEMIEEEKPEKSYTEGVPYYDEDFMLGFSEIMATGHENPEYLIKMPGYEKATLWCNASGHSMEPEISNGDIIALKRIDDPSFLPFGDIYGIITTNGLRTIKRIGRSQHDGYYRLIPTNKEYDEQEIPISKIAIVYRVMGAMKPF